MYLPFYNKQLDLAQKFTDSIEFFESVLNNSNLKEFELKELNKTISDYKILLNNCVASISNLN